MEHAPGFSRLNFNIYENKSDQIAAFLKVNQEQYEGVIFISVCV